MIGWILNNMILKVKRIIIKSNYNWKEKAVKKNMIWKMPYIAMKSTKVLWKLSLKIAV
jgi:hypothetical protein